MFFKLLAKNLEEIYDIKTQDILKSKNIFKAPVIEKDQYEKNKNSNSLPNINEKAASEFKNDPIVCNMNYVLKYENHCKLDLFKVSFFI